MGRIKSIFLIAASTLLLAPQGWASAADSVFLVKSVIEESGGTGFVTLVKGRAVLITNKHVCSVQTLSKKLRVSNDTSKYIGTIYSVSYRSDLCIVRLPATFDTTKHPPLILAPADADIGQVIHTIGYPRLVGPFPGSGALISKEIAWDYVVYKYVPIFRVAMLAHPGQSGSPIFDNTGAVVGVLVAINPHYGHTYYIPIAQLHEYLAEAFND